VKNSFYKVSSAIQNKSSRIILPSLLEKEVDLPGEERSREEEG
jgi:hypothetical protein